MNNAAIKILVVEDEELLREMLSMVLEDEGYQVDSACDGSEAWDLLKQHKYHLLATDLYMPNMNGVELVHKCKAAYPQTKILLLSGGGRDTEAQHGTDQVKFQGKQVAVDMYLKKPYKLEELLSNVESLV